MSDAAPISDSETDPGYRSRSQSRRSRRRKQAANKNNKSSMPPVPEHSTDAQASTSPNGDGRPTDAKSAASSKGSAPKSSMQPFERIGRGNEASMDGPVTYARAQRGEIPLRPGNPDQKLKTVDGEEKKESKMMDQDGLKLRLELNLDIEIELKASIHGDITLALLS